MSALRAGAGAGARVGEQKGEEIGEIGEWRRFSIPAPAVVFDGDGLAEVLVQLAARRESVGGGESGCARRQSAAERCCDVGSGA